MRSSREALVSRQTIWQGRLEDLASKLELKVRSSSLQVSLRIYAAVLSGSRD